MTIQFVHMNKINPINIAHVQHYGFHTADAERYLVFIFCPMNSGAKFNTYDFTLLMLKDDSFSVFAQLTVAQKDLGLPAKLQ